MVVSYGSATSELPHFQKETQTALDVHEPKGIVKYGETIYPTNVSLGTPPEKVVYVYAEEL